MIRSGRQNPLSNIVAVVSVLAGALMNMPSAPAEVVGRDVVLGDAAASEALS